jgi:hypothetical protein
MTTKQSLPDLPCNAAELGPEQLEHDQHLCLLAARLLSHRRCGSDLRVLALPDRRERNREAIELSAADDVGALSLEHTRLESFPEQIRAAARLRKVFPAFELSANVPDDSRFCLVVDPEAVDGITNAAKAHAGIVSWVERTAPTLEIRSPRTAPRHTVAGAPPDVPLPVILQRWPRDAQPGEAGRVRVLWAKPEDLEVRRMQRARIALDRKLKKLDAARAPGTTTVLVLENTDVALANVALIADALRDAASTNDDFVRPDEIVLIDTITTPMAWILLERGTWYPQVQDSGIHSLS